MAGFELATEDEGGEEEFLGRQTEAGAKEDFGRPAPGESHQAHAFFEVAFAGKEVEGRPDEDLRVERDQVGLVPVDALVVSGIDSPGFLGGKSEIGKALAGAHFSGA